MTAPEFAPKDWEPRFVDYLYLSLRTRRRSARPTTLPLTRWAKLTMMFQSAYPWPRSRWSSRERSTSCGDFSLRLSPTPAGRPAVRHPRGVGPSCRRLAGRLLIARTLRRIDRGDQPYAEDGGPIGEFPLGGDVLGPALHSPLRGSVGSPAPSGRTGWLAYRPYGSPEPARSSPRRVHWKSAVTVCTPTCRGPCSRGDNRVVRAPPARNGSAAAR